MLIVERIEEGIVVLEEDRRHEEHPVSVLTPSVQEGDVVYWKDGLLYRNEQETKARKERILALYRKIRK